MNKVYLKAFVAVCIVFLPLTKLFSWGIATQISGTGLNFHPHAAINDSGEAEVIWVSGSFPTFSVESSTFSVGWSAPIPLATGIVAAASVGIDTTGNAVAVWLELLLGNIVARSANKPAAGVWSEPSTISTSAFNRDLTMAMNGSGDVIAVWVDATTNNIEAAHLTFGGAWSAPIVVSTGLGTPLDLKVVIDSAGNGYTVWTIFEGFDIYAATSLGAVWDLPVLLSLNGDNSSPSIGVGGVLQALVAWQNQNISEIRTIGFSGGDWYRIPSVISPDSGGAPVAVATGLDGFVSWRDLNNGRIQVSNLNGGLWSEPPIDISSSVINEAPTISALMDETAVIVWSDFEWGTVNAVLFPNGGVVGSEQAISPLGNHISVYSTSSGSRTIATWQTMEGSNIFIFANIN